VTFGSDSGSVVEDAVQVFEMPEVPLLPTEGVQYDSLADNHIKQFVDSLMSLVYQRVQQ